MKRIGFMCPECLCSVTGIFSQHSQITVMLLPVCVCVLGGGRGLEGMDRVEWGSKFVRGRGEGFRGWALNGDVLFVFVFFGGMRPLPEGSKNIG